MQRLLELTGPVDMPEYGKIITPDNFLLETQKAVELEYDKTANTPKKFVGDLALKLMERLKTLDKAGWLKVASAVADALETKDIQIAMTDSDEEALAERYGWSGRLKEAFGDSLALVEANVAGQKTDGVIAEKVEHRVNIAADGSIEDAVTFQRTHNGIKGELFRGVRNVSYLRTYVPQGSKLLSAAGFQTPDKKLFKPVGEEDMPDEDIEQIETGAQTTPDGVTVMQEGERTVFGGWLQLDPGKTQTITLKYRLPFTVSDILAKLNAAPVSNETNARGAYLLLLTSQAGKTERKITTTVSFPEKWKLSWSKPATSATQLGYDGMWDRDHVLAALLTPADGQEAPQTAAAH